MRTIKYSSIAVLSILLMWAFTPSLSAKTFTSFSFNFGVAPRPAYYVAPQPVYVAPQPAYVVTPYNPYAAYYYPTPAPVVVQRPVVGVGIGGVVHPHRSYWRY